jgi:hypothetical protein
MKINSVGCLLLCTLALVFVGGARAADDVAYTGGAHPEHAKPGEVWCLITTPPQFKTVSEEVMCAPASCRFEKIPAVYEMQSEQVCSRKESTRCIDIPAVYKSESYEVQKCASRTEWQTVDCDNVNVSVAAKEQKGKCVALVTIPATFETLCRQVCVTPASTRTEVIPAEFKTVEKRVCTSEESQRRIEVPARYETRTKEVCVSNEQKVWRLSSCSAPAGVASCGKCEQPKTRCNSCDQPKAKCHTCNTCNTGCGETVVLMYDNNYNDGLTSHINGRRR